MSFVCPQCFVLLLLFLHCWPCKGAENTTSGNITETSTTKRPMVMKITIHNVKPEKLAKYPKLVCPEQDAARPFFSLPCKVTKECSQLGNKNMVCCNNRCLKGVPAPPPEPTHAPTLFGLVDRVCPSERVPELFEVKRCTMDADCSPRICCPENLPSGEIVGYCRTAEAKLERVPGVNNFIEPLKTIMSYMQCTPPPPPVLDVFPKACNNPLDCFPNLCCQERGKKFCRPPKRSILALLTTVAQRLVPSDFARDLITRLAP